VHAQPEDAPLTAEVTAALAARVGRVVFDGFPTGVVVGYAQNHGGPYPATTSSLHTSVGLTASRRWLRPVAFQDAPDHVLPPALREGNPLGIWRRVDGELTRER
jgi:NADP-dependent aldehyde dehydrogenase